MVQLLQSADTPRAQRGSTVLGRRGAEHCVQEEKDEHAQSESAGAQSGGG